MVINKKYEFTGETKVYDGRTLRRIRALQDIVMPKGESEIVTVAKSGDLGGWIQHEENLWHCGRCWVGSNAMVMDGAMVGGDAVVTDTSLVEGMAFVAGRVKLTGDTKVGGKVLIEGNSLELHNSRVYGEFTEIDGFGRISIEAKPDMVHTVKMNTVTFRPNNKAAIIKVKS